MAGVSDEVSLLTDEELRARLRHFNLPDGPITRTTRKMFERKLERALQIEAGVDQPELTQHVMANDTTVSIPHRKTDEQIKSETSGDLQPGCKEELTSTFYAVCLTSDGGVEVNTQTPLVFTDKSEALLSVKKNNGARFKAFNNRNEAEAFASGNNTTPCRQLSPVVAAAPVDPLDKFKAPKPGEIVHFRKLIERGELDSLLKLIYQNPKYLISRGDTPVILQEGFRYNAMHVAAKSGRKDVCQLLLNALQDESFWNLLYPRCDSKNPRDQNMQNRSKMFVLDLYLNAPDKGVGETPLHFACKYGKADVVQYLLSYPDIDKGILNKFGETPQQVICTRVPDCPDELRSRIEKLFTTEDRFYVTILRSEDNCSPAKVGAPWSPGLIEPEDAVDCGSPEDPRYKIRAYAGPMSPQEAEKFCFTLKSPRATPDKQSKFRNIKRSDSEKGLERVARKVAKSQNVAWCEYWKFLDCFTDLSTKDGLVKLEEYLRDKKSTCIMDTTKEDMKQTPVSDKPFWNTTQHEAYHSNDSVFDDKIENPQLDRVEKRHLGTPTGRNPDIKGFRNRLKWDDEYRKCSGSLESKLNVSNCSSCEDCGRIDGQVICQKNVNVRNSEDLNEGPVTHTQIISEEKKQNNNAKEEQLDELPVLRKLSFEGCEDSVMDVSISSEDSLGGLTRELGRLRLSSGTPSSKEESATEAAGVDLGRPQTNSKICSERACGNVTLNDKDVPYFLGGFQPSKVDVDVLRAIKSVKIDPELYPNVCRWQKMVRSFSKSDRAAWPGPGSPRFHGTRKGITNIWSC